MYDHVPLKYLRALATRYGVKVGRRDQDEIVVELLGRDAKHDLDHLEREFYFTAQGPALFILRSGRAWKWPNGDEFLGEFRSIWQVEEGHEGRPALSDVPQIVAWRRSENRIFLKMVEGRVRERVVGYDRELQQYAHYTHAVLDFTEKVVELRCWVQDINQYMDVMSSLVGEPVAIAADISSTDEVEKIARMLQTNASQRHVGVQSSELGSLEFNAMRGVDLRTAPTYQALAEAVAEQVGSGELISEVNNFEFIDPGTGLTIDVSFQIKMRQGGRPGYLRFVTHPSESVIDRVREALIEVVV